MLYVKKTFPKLKKKKKKIKTVKQEIRDEKDLVEIKVLYNLYRI